MGKVTLEYDSVEEQQEIKDAINGWKWRASVEELIQELRKVTKYDTSLLDKKKEPSDLEYELVNKVGELVNDILNDNDLI